MTNEDLKQRIREVLTEMGYPDLRGLTSCLAISENDLCYMDDAMYYSLDNKFTYDGKTPDLPF